MGEFENGTHCTSTESAVSVVGVTFAAAAIVSLVFIVPLLIIVLCVCATAGVVILLRRPSRGNKSRVMDRHSLEFHGQQYDQPPQQEDRPVGNTILTGTDTGNQPQ